MKLLVIIAIFGMFSTANSQFSYGHCFTPDEYRGSCIKFQECQPLFERAQRSPPNDEDRRFVSLSQCGFHDGKPLVCCRDQQQIEKPTKPLHVPPAHSQKKSLFPRTGICGEDATGKIYGGKQTMIEEYPWTALLGYLKPDGFGFHCGGVLINSKYVVTASHCVNGKQVSKWYLKLVRLGEWDTSQQVDCDKSFVNEEVCSDSPVDINIEEKIPHPDFNASDYLKPYNDIALLRLSTEVTFSDFIKPICLPFELDLRENDFVGQTLSVAGWGKTEKGTQSEIKLKVNVNGVSGADCNRVYNTTGKQIIDSQVCAGGKKGEDSCGGDSGGPLMRQIVTESDFSYWYLAGVVSFGPHPCGKEEWPGVYTRIASFIPWIEQEVRA